MPTPENAVKKVVDALLKKYGCYYEKPVPGGFGKSGLDYIVCHRGRYASIETKASGKKPTPRQELTINAIRAAGGRAFVVAGDDGLDLLEWWLKDLM